jgi:hypothetical protein
VTVSAISSGPGEKKAAGKSPSSFAAIDGSFQPLDKGLLRLFSFFFLCILYLDSDFLADLLDVLKDFSRPCACGFVAALEFFVFGFQQFDFLGQFLKTH